VASVELLDKPQTPTVFYMLADIEQHVLQHQSINQCYICSNGIHREFMPAIHRKSLAKFG
jgi:hypothetical protein